MSFLDALKAKPEEQAIRIECVGSSFVTLDELHDLHSFGIITDDHYAKGRNSITELGFSFPFFYWKEPETNKVYILDGHGRRKILKRMQDEGFIIPPLPACEVYAKDKKEAKLKLLAQESRYKDISDTAFTDFLAEDDLTVEDIDYFADIPDLDLSTDDTINKGNETNEEATCGQCKSYHDNNHTTTQTS